MAYDSCYELVRLNEPAHAPPCRWPRTQANSSDTKDTSPQSRIRGPHDYIALYAPNAVGFGRDNEVRDPRVSLPYK